MHSSFSSLDAEYRETLRRLVRGRCEQAVEGYAGHACAEALEEFILDVFQNCYTTECMSHELKACLGHAGEDMATWVQYQANILAEQHATDTARVSRNTGGILGRAGHLGAASY